MTQLIKDEIRTKEVLEWKGIHLLHFSNSSCSQKTRIFLNLKGIEWVSHPVNLATDENYSDWFLGINPRALVPVLVDDGEVHIESNDILKYLEKKFPEPSLIPNESIELISTLLNEEDDLHIDMRNISFRFLFGNKARKKKTSSIEKLEEDSGTIQGKEDSHKIKELTFFKDFNEEGITDEAVIQSVSKFKKLYDNFESNLSKQPYLLGVQISLLDIAWFIYTHRLFLSGYPFNKLHPKVLEWYKHLLNKKEFSKEVKEPIILKAMRSATRVQDKIAGTVLSKISNL
ncbi:glutathione S-transferase family protein [Gammaproteobacteria bacterium]|nr:glutathione S-transferase family protein [Gammaproteobacteria bacterium]